MHRIELDHMVVDRNGLLGPTPRLVLWLHGCDRNCPGCIAIDWNTKAAAEMTLSVSTLLQMAGDYPSLEGVTISGGEPFRQSEPLSRLVAALHDCGLGIILYTGYTLAQLKALPPANRVENILTSVDVLIDGAYVADMDDGLPFRGSANQIIHHFSNRYQDYFSLNKNRKSIIEQRDGHYYLLGIPDACAKSEWADLKDTIGLSNSRNSEV